MDDWGGLENRCGLRATVGSNPTLSAERKILELRLSICLKRTNNRDEFYAKIAQCQLGDFV